MPPSPTPAIRLFCVDDHALLIEGLRAQFAITGRVRIVGRLSSADRLLDEVDRVKPDVVLMDVEMPGPDAFEAADRLARRHPGLRIAFLSAHIRDGYLAAAVNCGARGYFAKADSPEDIVRGIRALAASRPGDFVMGPKVSRRCGPPPRTGSTTPSTPLNSLSDREIEVLRLIGKGLSRTQIAQELSRSPKTVDGHQERIMRKLGITSRAELLRFAIREGLAQA